MKNKTKTENNISFFTYQEKLKKDGFVSVKVKVIPKSKQARKMEMMDDGVIKIYLKSAPEKGRANKELVKMIAKKMDIDVDQIKIAGTSSRVKILKIRL